MPSHHIELWSAPVDERFHQGTLGEFLLRKGGISSTLLKSLKATGGLLVNGRACRTNTPLKPGDQISVVWTATDSPNVVPEELPLCIVHEDADLVVVNKPAGMVVHPTNGVYSGTVANALAWRYQSQNQASNIHPVHRLDRMTSGLLVFARHPLAHQRLGQQLSTTLWHREYRALVSGRLVSDSGMVAAPITRTPDHPVKRRVGINGQTAITQYQVIRRNQHSTDLNIRLLTGRTHQIRVHMAFIGHPLIQDDLYGEGVAGHILRHALHASKLSFVHPRHQTPVTFESPLPDDWPDSD